jgi:hypothetical protein
MILFLSDSFLRRLQLVWKSNLNAFLVGQRNLFFFVPDSLFEVESISPESINQFLKERQIPADWQLLGFLSSQTTPQLPGYARVETSGQSDPTKWKAVIALLVDSGLQDRTLEIRQSKTAVAR